MFCSSSFYHKPESLKWDKDLTTTWLIETLVSTENIPRYLQTISSSTLSVLVGDKFDSRKCNQMASDGVTPTKHPSDGWKERITIPTIIAGVVGGGVGLLSRHRKVHGATNLAATYATNLAIVTGCYCGARELARDARSSEQDDLINSVIGGIASGALLGRLQGGQLGAIRYALTFAVAGTAVDYATVQLRPYWQSFRNTISAENLRKIADSNWKLPDWSPIQVLDEEALAAKRAREEQLYTQRTLGKLNKEGS